jgi:hypothetical protein
MHLQKMEIMRISSNQRESLEYAGEELRSLAHLIERILDRNPDASGEELRDLGILWELILETSKQLKMIRLNGRTNQNEHTRLRHPHGYDAASRRCR